jgi:DNA invertase Pin-like site-specific DNA recombinase
MSRILGYIRVSTDKQADRGVSLEAQEAKIRAYCSLYGHELVDVVVDAGESAKSLDRPGLQQALALLAGGEVRGLLVVKLDRLTRSIRDLSDLVDQSTRHGWSLMSVGEQLDTSTAAGRMVLNILGVIGQWEREAIGERTAAALAHKRAMGEYCGGRPAFGTAAVEGALAQVDEEQATISEARRLRADGLSLREVAGQLAENGRLSRAGKPFAAQQIARMIAD